MIWLNPGQHYNGCHFWTFAKQQHDYYCQTLQIEYCFIAILPSNLWWVWVILYWVILSRRQYEHLRDSHPQQRAVSGLEWFSSSVASSNNVWAILILNRGQCQHFERFSSSTEDSIRTSAISNLKRLQSVLEEFSSSRGDSNITWVILVLNKAEQLSSSVEGSVSIFEQFSWSVEGSVGI